MVGRVVVEGVRPVVAGGAFPGRAVVGEHVPISATVWQEGHEAVAATVVWQGPYGGGRARMTPDGEDGFVATIVPDAVGRWTFRVDGWRDPWATWRHKMTANLAAGLHAPQLRNDFADGAHLLERVAYRPDRRAERDLLLAAADALRDADRTPRERFAAAMTDEVERAMREFPVRDRLTKGSTWQIWVDRPRALFGSWYEMFPRSTGGRAPSGKPVHGTFATARKDLDRIADMGFDVVYLPPIHPIGRVNRKGRDNRIVAGPEDVGSPWAIGAREGGHDAVHPDLGAIDDFDRFVARAAELGLEVALDFALQCAPDHPWVSAHPEWFHTRSDGSIAYAENPPKRYEDIYPLDFDSDARGLRGEVLRVVEHWIDHGVRIFRVDNPHTKPPAFWHWLIWAVKRDHPDVLFLAEAFANPTKLYGLARLGFTQSYTYFTWRDTKAELTEFGEQLVERADEMRGNLFVNTPDILPKSVQDNGEAGFAIRATLAATLSPTWGVYSGFELYEDRVLRPGTEEYAASEKYELRPRDYATAHSLAPWVTRLNQIRHAHPALRQQRGLVFHKTDNESLIAYSRTDPGTGQTVLCVVTLDPWVMQEGTVQWDQTAFGLAEGALFAVHDQVSDELYGWHGDDYVKLDPRRAVAHIAVVVRP
ncbi:alpha-1,4-glucan--maltose-1-phosphate maltosyltransferase [Actinokineospora auranticolor]|uniref:Alpha-1,4-glucan:maltose-1-phosphate maltosyltransferase n=1 Tax=Actinokineospora auranticolor TaxID=155976 RepID=A0A2S6GJL4_9PSEU|nr:alpha-1,4-glucan--maltose-1-phosphate maltosyltransferase [Actinokineospora auranticolor]PPK65422.1 starch synthase (maltosyl-transferring) [Actinokineospora auranticolor]